MEFATYFKMTIVVFMLVMSVSGLQRNLKWGSSGDGRNGATTVVGDNSIVQLEQQKKTLESTIETAKATQEAVNAAIENIKTSHETIRLEQGKMAASKQKIDLEMNAINKVAKTTADTSHVVDNSNTNAGATYEWSKWGECSVTCGSGTRTRTCADNKMDILACGAKINAEEACNNGECPTTCDSFDRCAAVNFDRQLYPKSITCGAGGCDVGTCCVVPCRTHDTCTTTIGDAFCHRTDQCYPCTSCSLCNDGFDGTCGNCDDNIYPTNSPKTTCVVTPAPAVCDSIIADITFLGAFNATSDCTELEFCEAKCKTGFTGDNVYYECKDGSWESSSGTNIDCPAVRN